MKSVAKTIIKWFSALLIAVLVISMTMVALGRMTWQFFWVIVIITAIIAYYVLPRIRKEL